MQALPYAEQGKHAVMDGSEMTDEIEQAVFPGRYLLLELFAGKRLDGGAEAADDELPGVECGACEQFIAGHFNLALSLVFILSFDGCRRIADAKCFLQSSAEGG